MTTALVFVIVSGELDLAFPSVMGAAGGLFMTLVISGVPILPAAALTMLGGAVLGAAIGAIVVYGKISSLVATLGLNFFIVGHREPAGPGQEHRKPRQREHLRLCVLHRQMGRLRPAGAEPFPDRRRLDGAVLCPVQVPPLRHPGADGGRQPGLARQMGINIDRIRVGVFVWSGLAAALCGVILVQTANMVWFPTSGKAYLLIALAALFVGGTPTWGGVGTIWGAFFGALTVTLIPSGAVGAGFAGFWTDFIFGLVIILTMVAHRFGGARVR
jgi:simple sugar transport system permease protein